MSGNQENWTRQKGPKAGSCEAITARKAMASGYEVEQDASIVDTNWGGKTRKGYEYDVEVPRLTGGK